MTILPLTAAAEALYDSLNSGGILAISTGAGMSRDSGIPTFRGSEGLWRQYRAEDLATPEAFHRDPRLFWEFNESLRDKIQAAQPHAGHYAISRLQQTLAPLVTTRVITQNIDRLHEAAGSEAVLHLHGDIIRVYCPGCGWADDDYPCPVPDLPPRCSCGGILRPDIVLFHEALPERVLDEAFQLARECTVMLVVGTSVMVQPAALLPEVALQAGAVVIEINPHETPLTSQSHHSLRGPAIDLLPALVEAVKAARG